MGPVGMSTTFAELVYQACLNRTPSVEEVADIAQWLGEGYDHGDILAWVFNSDEAVEYRSRLFVPPGHPFSPIVDVASLKKHYRRGRKPDPVPMLDIDLDRAAMTALWENHLAAYVKSTPFTPEPDAAHRFHGKIPTYSMGDAAILRAMIAHHKPRRILETGSGGSMACILDTLDEFALETVLTSVDMAPEALRALLRPGDRKRIEFLATPVQDVPLARFEELDANDFLLINSKHVLKTESDLQFLLSEALPRLKPGVVIRFFGIFYPFEYFRGWVIEQNRSWNEAYAVRAFLAYNERFKVIFFNHMFALLEQAKLAADFPKFVETPGAELWIKRVS